MHRVTALAAREDISQRLASVSVSYAGKSPKRDQRGMQRRQFAALDALKRDRSSDIFKFDRCCYEDVEVYACLMVTVILPARSLATLVTP